jgi:hypothetical protein
VTIGGVRDGKWNSSTLEQLAIALHSPTDCRFCRQIIWQVSPQSPVVWLLHEVHCWVVWVCAEASSVLIAVAADCSLAVGVWRSLRITAFGTYQGASAIMRKAFDWKRSRIPVLEVEAVPQSCIP